LARCEGRAAILCFGGCAVCRQLQVSSRGGGGGSRGVSVIRRQGHPTDVASVGIDAAAHRHAIISALFVPLFSRHYSPCLSYVILYSVWIFGTLPISIRVGIACVLHLSRFCWFPYCVFRGGGRLLQGSCSKVRLCQAKIRKMALTVMCDGS
jgi:hypothetical protein